MNHAEAVRSDEAIVTGALLEAGGELGLTLAQLAVAVGVSTASMKNYSRGTAILSSPKTQELALGLVRVYRSLYAIVGGNREQMQHWMRTPNHHLRNEAPANLVTRYEGLALVNHYLDGMRGRL
ncbi:XRE family transcriptional regulator [Parahaliea mediterranea]|uniref:XRE family transcriptional regulator n=1 Tax=Parahaliea mediterranea TaxID=651086 RepID=UPI000E2F919B|nr:XRE family transcriptional regulator [Parahaliea mediterranea]